MTVATREVLLDQKQKILEEASHTLEKQREFFLLQVMILNYSSQTKELKYQALLSKLHNNVLDMQKRLKENEARLKLELQIINKNLHELEQEAQDLEQRKQRAKRSWFMQAVNDIALPLALLGAFAMLILGLDSVMPVIGIGTFSFVVSVVVAGFAGVAFFAQDSFSFLDAISDLAMRCYEFPWRNYIANHKRQVFMTALTLAAMCAAAAIIVFPPAGLAAFIAGSFLSGVSTFALASMAAGATYAAVSFIRNIPEILGGIYSAIRYRNVPSVSRKTFWARNLPRFVGFPMAITAAMVSGAVVFGPFLAVSGVGWAAGTMSALVGLVIGMHYYTQDGSTLRRRLEGLGKKIDEFKLVPFVKKNYMKIAGAALTVAAILTTTVCVLFPPAAIATSVTAGIATLGLTGASPLLLGVMTTGVTYLSCKVIGACVSVLVNQATGFFNKLFVKQKPETKKGQQESATAKEEKQKLNLVASEADPAAVSSYKKVCEQLVATTPSAEVVEPDVKVAKDFNPAEAEARVSIKDSISTPQDKDAAQTPPAMTHYNKAQLHKIISSLPSIGIFSGANTNFPAASEPQGVEHKEMFYSRELASA